MLLLLISLVVLGAGPLLHRLAGRARPALAALDGFIFTAIAGMVLLVIIPDTVEAAGWAALLAALLGFLAPGLLERGLGRAAAAQTHAVTLALALFGLVLHALIDGVVLQQGPQTGSGGQVLALAVLLHRLPVALTVWWLLAPSYGGGRATAVLLAIGLATIAGFFLGSTAVLASSVAVIQALVTGSLLHVLVHCPRPMSAAATVRGWRLPAGLGAAAGLGLVYALLVVGHGHAADHQGDRVVSAFVALAAQSAPALLVAYFGAGLLHAFLPRATVRWMGRGSSISQTLRGMGFGLPLPVCSCGVIPLYRTLVLRGAPTAAALAFLVATPEIGIDAFLLSFPLLGSQMTIARLAAAALVAILAGWLVGRLAESHTDGLDDTPLEPVEGTAIQRLAAGLRMGLGELVDTTAPWILLGLAIAAVATPLLDAAWFAALPPGSDVAIFALIGMPVYVCASGATPLVAMLIYKGVSPGAALAFLLTGPATNATTFGVLAQLHGRRLALWFALTVAGISIALGYLLNLVLIGPVRVFSPPSGEPHLSPLATLALAGLGILVGLSLLRQGPRHFAGQIVATATEHDHDDHDVDANENGPGDSCCSDGCH